LSVEYCNSILETIKHVENIPSYVQPKPSTKNKKVGFEGVLLPKGRKRYRLCFRYNEKKYRAGGFKTAEDAGRAYGK
jgi:hypothetical protein